jgi:hypothetical protein
MKDLQGKELERAKERWHHRHWLAIQAADALSELKDPSGLELAARMAIESKRAAKRRVAFSVLTNLAMCDKSVLVGQTIDPLSVLITAAESETDPGSLNSLSNCAHSLSGPMAKPILQRLVASPHLREKTRALAQYRLKGIEKETTDGKKNEGQ